MSFITGYTGINTNRPNPPGIAEYPAGSGTLYMVFQDPGGNGIMFATSSDGVNWVNTQYSGYNTSGGPCAVTFGGNLHVFYRDPSGNGLMHIYWNGSSWQGYEHVGNLTLDGQPSAAVLPGNGNPDTLCVLMVDGGGNGIMYATWTTGWNTGYTSVNTNSGSYPGITVFNGGFYMVFQDSNGHNGIMTATSPDGANGWTNNIQYTGFNCTYGPCVQNVQGVLNAFYQDGNNNTGLMTITSNDGANWAGQTHISNAVLNYQPSAAVTAGGSSICILMIDGATNQSNGIMYANSFDTSIITPSNTQLANVATTFSNIPTTPSYRKYFTCNDDPTSIDGLAQSHFKGIACYRDKFVFSHTDLEIVSPQQNGKWIIANDPPGPGTFQTEGTFDTLHPGWPHPCASQACGSFMAQGIQLSASDPGDKVSEIEILDIRMIAVNQPPSLLGVISRPSEGVNGVGMTKETGDDGRYIVGALNGGSLTFYRSQSSSLITNGQPTVAFDQIFQEDGFAESGAGLAMVTQQDGGIFVITLNADDDTSNSKACLYQLSDPAGQPSIAKISEVDLPVPVTDLSDTVSLLVAYTAIITIANPPLGVVLAALLTTLGELLLNSSFRWGKGLAVTSETTIELYASDRNVWPLSSIPLVGSDKDFSVLVWASGNPNGHAS